MAGKYKVSPPAERRLNGRTYGSKAEMEYAQLLYLMRDGGDIKDFVQQPRLWLGVPENIYIPDFLVIPKESFDPYYIDIKGMETQKFRRDKKLWASYGWLNLHVIKKQGKKFKTTEVVHGCSDTRRGTA
jgi:hypothetical protein